MFSTIIGQSATKFTAPPADSMFPNIQGRTFRGDYSFIATLRVLLKDRIPEGHSFTMNMHDSITVNRSYSDEAEFLAHTIGHIPEREICVINLRQRDKVQADETIEKFDQNLSSFENKRDLSLLMEQTKTVQSCRIYVNEERCAAIIMVNSMVIAAWHALQCLIPRMIRPYFMTNKPTSEEVKLLCALNTATDETYLQLMNELAEGIDFRGFLLKNVVGGVVKRAAEVHINNLREEIRRSNNRTTELMEEYGRLVRKIDNDNATLAGYIMRRNAGENDNELMDFLSSQMWFDPIEQSSNGFSFTVKTFLDQFDPDMYEAMARNRHSFLWGTDYGDAFNDREDRLLLMNALFSSEATMKINACAYFNMDIRGEISTCCDYSYPEEYEDRFANPHLDFHSCFGDHRTYIQDRIRAGDLIGAVMQCKTSASSLNVGEEPTMRPFLGRLFTTTKKCIHLEDGRDATPVEALKILKEGSNA